MVKEILAMLTSLRPVTKIFLIVSIAASTITFMVLAAQIGMLDDIIKWALN